MGISIKKNLEIRLRKAINPLGGRASSFSRIYTIAKAWNSEVAVSQISRMMEMSWYWETRLKDKCESDL